MIKIREIIGWGLYKFLYPLFKSKIRFLSLYFHDPSPALFEKVVKWGVKKGYRFIDIDECYALITRKKKTKEKVIYLSFDDGWKSNLDLIPIIEKYNVPITIFVSVNPISEGNYWWEYALKQCNYSQMNEIKKLPYLDFCNKITELKATIKLDRSSITEQELKQMSKHPLISIQSHTMSHPILINCPDDKLKYELEQSKNYFETTIDKPIYAFSYPNGDFGKREIEAVKDAGYTIAFTTKSDYINIGNIDLFRVPRMAINTNGGYYENLSKIIGAWQRVIKKQKF